MRVIFLDIDGVLNSREWDAQCAITGDDLLKPSPVLVVRLLGVVQETDAKIVLTSSWRLDKTMAWPFPVHDVTPRVDGPRVEEIRAWLRDHPTERDGLIDAFVILDDEPDAGAGFEDRFVQTDPRVGLTAEDAARIVGLFT